MFEKLTNSKINEIADWIIRLVVINVMVVFFSLGIVTIYPAFLAGYKLFSDYVKQKETKMFKDFFKYFKQDLLKKVGFGFIIFLVFLLGYLNARYYFLSLENNQSSFYVFGYYISLSLIAIWTVITFYSLVSFSIFPKLSVFRLFKLSFYLAGKFYWLTLLWVVIIIGPPFLIIIYLPRLAPVILVFFGISMPLIFSVLLTRRVVAYLEKLGDYHG